jgi:hypothetical protein
VTSTDADWQWTNVSLVLVVMPPGAYRLELVVSDGMASATNGFSLEVIITTEAVQKLIDRVKSNWARPQPLLATLAAC